MSYNLLKGKRGIIFGALDPNSIAWITAERVHEEGGKFVLSNAPIAMRMGQINELAEKTGSQVIAADATSEEDLENLVKKYGPQRAVDGISFEVKSGEILGFLGPNGAGKTTTMKMITCYMAPSDGDIKVGNYSILKDQAEIKKCIGYLPEHNPLYLDMPVMEYLAFAAAIQGVAKSKIQERIREMVLFKLMNKCTIDNE